MRNWNWITGAALGLAIGTSPGLAEPQREKAVFDLYLKGLRAGTLAFSAVSEGSQYAVSGRLKSAGLAQLLRSFDYEASTRGQMSQDRYRPGRFEQTARNKGETRRTMIAYRAGTPRSVEVTPPRAKASYDIAPGAQSGTIDPLSALFAALGAKPEAKTCNLSLNLYDGRRRSALKLGAPQKSGETISCRGEYRRIAGYPAKELAEKTSFPFTLTYAPGPDGLYQVIEVRMDTVLGQGRLVRRGRKG